jgi:Heterokaryon incompatibility protein (HET)
MPLPTRIRSIRDSLTSGLSSNNRNPNDDSNTAKRSSSFNFQALKISDFGLSSIIPADQVKSSHENKPPTDKTPRPSLDDVKVIEQWIRSSRIQHGTQGHLWRQVFTYPKWDMVFVDVTNRCLVVEPLRDYVALSYVNGDAQRFQLTRKLLKKLQEPNSLRTHIHPFPQVIQDAIDVTRTLGYHRLWVRNIKWSENHLTCLGRSALHCSWRSGSRPSGEPVLWHNVQSCKHYNCRRQQHKC